MPPGNIRTLYLDTSVVGGYFDAEYQKETRLLWELWKSGRYRFISSVVVEEEIEPHRNRCVIFTSAPFPKIAVFPSRWPQLNWPGFTWENGVVTPKYLTDARHVAVCSVAAISHLVSWNFRHLVNVEREAGFNAINLLQGHAPVRIVSPWN